MKQKVPVPATKRPGHEAKEEQLAWSAEVEEVLRARAHPNDASGEQALPGRATKMYLASLQREERLRAHRERTEARRLQGEARRLLDAAEARAEADLRVRRHLEWVAEARSSGATTVEPITVIPPVPVGHAQRVITEVVPGRSYLRILYDEDRHRHVYEVIEPRLGPVEVEVRAFLRETLVRTLPARQDGGDGVSPEQVLHDAVRDAVVDHSIMLDEVGMHRVLYFLVRDFLGFGPVDVLMRDPSLEDVSCDGPGVPVFVYHRDHGSLVTNVVFSRADELDGYVLRLAQRCGKHISIADPLLDATLPDGSRLQASFSREVTTRGSSFTIRRFRAEPMTPVDLVQVGSWDARVAAYFWMMVEHGASMMLAGGTASGKTTTLNAVCQFIPPERKIVSIEDTREINLRHDNWIAGVTRPGFAGASGPGVGVDMYRLLEAALRQRPEYLLVGEVRGKEALTLFQAMATGHAVYSTMHADSVPSAVYRLENQPINVPRLMLQTLDIMAVQGLSQEEGRTRRRVLEVTEMTGFDPASGDLLTNTVFRWDSHAGQFFYTGRSVLLEEYAQRRRLSPEQLHGEWAARRRVIEWMVAHDVHDLARVAAVIAQYYRDATRLEAVGVADMGGPA